MRPAGQTPTPALIELLASADTRALAELLTDDVVFRSPVTDYHGRADVIHLLGLIGRVLDDPVATSTAADGATRLTSFTARVDGSPAEGVLRERHDDRGRLMHLTLFLRPYRVLQAAIHAMRRLLAEDPLPGGR